MSAEAVAQNGAFRKKDLARTFIGKRKAGGRGKRRANLDSRLITCDYACMCAQGRFEFMARVPSLRVWLAHRRTSDKRVLMQAGYEVRVVRRLLCWGCRAKFIAVLKKF